MLAIALRPVLSRLIAFIAPNLRLRQELKQLKFQLNDWPQLSSYQALNANLAPPASDETRVVFLGDSITEFWNFTASFPEKPYINRGISGQTTAQMVLRFQPDVVALRPKVVLLLAGTNDLAGNAGIMTLTMIMDNLVSIAQLAQANQIQLIMASVLPIHDYGAVKQSEQRSPSQIRALNNWLKQYSNQHDHIYLDYYSQMIDRQGVTRI